MRPDDSPFPAYWWGSALDRVGLSTVREDMGTYGRYDFSLLPPVPFPTRGDLAWLRGAPVHHSHIGQEKAADIASNLATLRASLQQLRLSLPPAFITFFEEPGLQSRVRSSTDCYLDLCLAPVPSPVGRGSLVRFLADSQGCLFWYLFLPRDNQDHAIVASPGFYGTDDEQWQDEPPDSSDLVFVAEEFETFLWRFWLENEIWYAAYYDKTPIPVEGVSYIQHYLARAHERA